MSLLTAGLITSLKVLINIKWPFKCGKTANKIAPVGVKLDRIISVSTCHSPSLEIFFINK